MIVFRQYTSLLDRDFDARGQIENFARGPLKNRFCEESDA